MINPYTYKSYLTLIVLFLFFCLSTNAQQNVQVESITTEDGLSQGMVYDILQDREGFLWIATKDGLNRYDGYHFEVFTNDPNNPWSISGNTIKHLFEDSAGRIWATSVNAGINIYDKKTGRFHHIRHDPQDPASLSGNYISSIVEDSSGYFVVVVDESEINMFRLDDDFFRIQQSPQVLRVPFPAPKTEESFLSTIVKGLVKDSKDRIWVGGKEVMYRLNVKQAKLEIAVEGFSIGTVFTNPDGSFWACGNYQPLFHWDGENATPFLFKLAGAIDIRVDGQENMWFLRVDSLFGIDLTGWRNTLDKDRDLDRFFYRWQPRTSAGNYPFESMTIDRSGLIWVGTNGLGLYKINPNHRRFAHYLPGNSIRQFSIVSADKWYLFSYLSTWYTQDGKPLGGNPLGYEKNHTVSDFMLVSKSGDYWIRQPTKSIDGSEVIRYNPQTKEKQFYSVSWHHYDSQPMIESRDGSIWMSGFNDILTHINPLTGAVMSYNLKDGKRILQGGENEKIISHEYSTALREDVDGVLWVGTERGFTKVIRSTSEQNKLQITKYQNISGAPNSLSYNHVTSFLDDPFQPDRFLWISTKGGGINRMDKQSSQFMRLTKEDGLPDDVVYGILPDDDGNLWGSTNKGLFCMSPIKDIKAGASGAYSFRNFSKAEGLQENEFNTGAYAKLPDGRLAFGGVNGYNVFDPKEILSDGFNPPTYITNILVNNQPVSPNDESEILINTIETTRKITLSHLDNILTLEFASLDFNAPDRNKYRYQLVGADDTWVEAGNRRSATFLNLQPNDYTFRVQGSNSQGIWSDQIAELQISILPPWWKTWWAYLFYTAIIIALIWTYFRFSVRRAELRQQLAFEKREADRVRDLDALKTQLFTNLTHEFRTPLTIILGMAKQVKNNPKEHFNTGIDMIIRNGQNLLGLINKMLNLSKLEGGKMSLEPVHGDIVFFLKNIVESFQSYAVNKEIQLHFLPEVDAVMMNFDADKLQQVVSNLLSNSFKFTPDGGHIYFTLREENNTLAIRIKDTGRGIPEKDLEKVFDRFHQADNSSTREFEGTGIGLALSKELVKLMKGEISVQSPPVGAKKGSEFLVLLPIEQSVASVKPANFEEIKIMKPVIDLPESSSNETKIKPQNETKTADNQQVKKESKPLILIAEDNEDVAAYVASCLTDYRLAVAENGREGLEIAIEMIPDLIISDVMMPVMDGFEFCQKLKSDKRTDHIPVIILTARADLDSKLEGLEIGANAYLPKPFEKKELLLNIRNLFGLRDKLRQHYQNIAGIGESEEFNADNSVATKPEDEFVIKVREIIEVNIGDFDFNVEQLAKELHLSHSQFGRKLDALTGFSPNRFIRFIRLKKAKELLKDQDLSITAVAYDCGFSDPSYFTRIFKKEFGKSPVEWRAQLTS